MSKGLLLVALAGLLAGGAYNYHRNYQAETAGPRPYAGYAQADLKALLEAYEAENRALGRRYESARRTEDGGAARGGLLDENIRAFEQAQQRSERVRGLGAQLAMRQEAVRQIQAELEKREAERDVVALHLRRLITL